MLRRCCRHALASRPSTCRAVDDLVSPRLLHSKIGTGEMDLAILRIQVDYVRLSLDGLKKNNTRAFIGGVLPLCFRACEGYWAAIGQ